MGLSYSDDKDDAGFGAMISAEGELSDYIKLPMILTSRKTWNEKVKRLNLIKDKIKWLRPM